MSIDDSNKAPLCSIITVSYKSQGEIEKLLSSIFDVSSIRDKFEVIVVSNSGDCRELTNEQADKVVQSNGNVGFAKGCNNGAKVANGKFLLFCNPDIRIRSEDILKLCLTLEEYPSIGLISPVFNAETYKSIGDILIVKERVIGACLCISSKLLEELGGWDENFFLWGEDRDLGTRVRNQNLDVAIHTGILVSHLSGHSWRNANKQQSCYFTQVWLCSQTYYRIKHFGLFRGYTYCITDIVKNIVRLIFRRPTYGRINLPLISIHLAIKLLLSKNLKENVTFNGKSYPWEAN